MSLHDQPRLSAAGQLAHPFAEQCVQRLLSDPDWGIGKKVRDREIRRDVLWGYDPDAVADPCRERVRRAQVSGTFVGVHGPNGALGVSQRQSERDRAVTRSEIHQVAGLQPRIPEFVSVGVPRSDRTEQDPGAGVDAVGGEHAAVGVQRHRQVG